jgi:dehydrogenase/reductase SDR family member 7B
MKQLSFEASSLFFQFTLLIIAASASLVLGFTFAPLRRVHSSQQQFPRSPSDQRLATFTIDSVITKMSSSSTPTLSVKCKSHTKDTLKGQTVCLTGATGGLGRALAWQLADCGVDRLLLSGRSSKALDEVVQECQTINRAIQCDTLVCDLSNPDDVSQLAQQIQAKGRVDILINNGGVSSRSTFINTQPEIDRQVMQINFFSGAALAKAVIPGMIQQGSGRIIWISSVQGLVGIPERTSYAASKFAVQGYTESLRAEVAGAGVSIHTVSPGYIRTNLSKNAVRGDGTAHGKVDETTAAGADPVEVAAELLDRCVAGQVDFTIAATFSAVAAIWLRCLCPGLLRSQLVKRFETSQAKQKAD